MHLKKKKIIDMFVMNHLHTLVDRQYVQQVQALALDMVAEQEQAHATNSKKNNFQHLFVKRKKSFLLVFDTVELELVQDTVCIVYRNEQKKKNIDE
jgi:hypothetical protein